MLDLRTYLGIDPLDLALSDSQGTTHLRGLGLQVMRTLSPSRIGCSQTDPALHQITTQHIQYADRPDDHHSPSCYAVRLKQSYPFQASSTSSQLETVICLLALAGAFGLGKDHLPHQKTRRVETRQFAKTRKSSSDILIHFKLCNGLHADVQANSEDLTDVCAKPRQHSKRRHSRTAPRHHLRKATARPADPITRPLRIP